jgi:hypothetical protein
MIDFFVMDANRDLMDASRDLSVQNRHKPTAQTWLAGIPGDKVLSSDNTA